MLLSAKTLLARHRLTTPIAALDLDELEQSVRSIAIAHQECGIVWRPMARSPVVPAQLDVLRSAHIASVFLGTLPLLDFAIFKGFEIDLLRPPITPGGAGLLADALEHATIAVVCDHFAQAEPLARAADEIGREIVIDLRLSAQRDDWGMLPGPELENLARGIARLPAARLRGLALPVPDTNRTTDSVASSASIARLALAGTASLRKSGHRPEIVFVDNLEDGRRLSVELPDVPCASMVSLPDARLILAGVIARPSREVAILDAGIAEIGSDPSLLAGGRWRVETVHTQFTRLRCDGGGEEMAIGDVALVRPSTELPFSACPIRLLKFRGMWEMAAPE